MRSRAALACLLLTWLHAGCGPERRPGEGLEGAAEEALAAGVQDTVGSNGASITDTTTYPDHSEGVPAIEQDGFRITPRMLENARFEPSVTYAFQGRWFNEVGADQVLAIEEYTDHHQLNVYLFRKGQLPTSMLEAMDITRRGVRLPVDTLRRVLPGLFASLNTLNADQFVSRKGIRLGCSMKEAIEVFGASDPVRTEQGMDVLEWHFLGDGNYDGRIDRKGRPLVSGSFGQDVWMYFRKGRLVAYRLHNAIP
jgi:hypothetical protein